MTDRKVRTAAGEEYFHLPIGTPLTRTNPEKDLSKVPWQNPTVPPSISGPLRGYTVRRLPQAAEKFALTEEARTPADRLEDRTQ